MSENVAATDIIWKSLGGEISVNSKQFLMFSNITANNCAITPITDCRTSAVSTTSTVQPLTTALQNISPSIIWVYYLMPILELSLLVQQSHLV
ncbi:MAG: hypothetical protein HC903_30785 [Methylacidiphilales bacterium]|nr:hypothetical protein [Candidatus Methylacidiphilales bacterium]